MGNGLPKISFEKAQEAGGRPGGYRGILQAVDES